MLTCYRIRDQIDGAPLERFDQALSLQDPGPRQVQEHQLIEGRNFAAQLYTVSTPAHEIGWVPFLRGGWPELQLPNVANAGAVLFVAVPRPDGRFTLAFTFGVGRYLLAEGATEPGFGIRTALNVIYEGGPDRDPSRLRALDAKRVALNTLRTRYQANRSTSLEIFDVDVMRDILSGITGNPTDEAVWGSRIDGRETLTVHGPTAFEDLGDLTRRIADAAERQDYREGFAWIDNVRFVQDERLRERLIEALIERLRAQEIDSMELVVPETINWAIVDAFRYSFDRDVTRPDIALSHYLGYLAAKGKLEGLDVAKLKRDRVIALDDAGHESYNWSVWRCLDAQLDVDGATYVLDGGDFYGIDADYLTTLNAFVDGLPPGTHDLPPARLGEWEQHYLARVCEPPTDYLLLDRRLVYLGGRTSSVEVCDLLATDGALIHAKRNHGSSELSHLFSQGLVSAELLVANPEFREKAREKVATVAGERPDGPPPWPQSLDEDPFDPRHHDVAYVVICQPGSGSLRERLPFFSKVNLRRCVADLEVMRFMVSCRVVLEAP
jgi:uncharacterized protein (TIGR04141 family)